MDDRYLSEKLTGLCDEKLAEFENQPLPEHGFSQDFQAKMEATLRRKPRNAKRIHWQMAAMLALVISLTATGYFLSRGNGQGLPAETHAGMETTGTQSLIDPTLFVSKVTAIPEGYEMSISESPDVICYTFQGEAGTIQIEQRMYNSIWYDFFLGLGEDAAKGRDNVKMVPMYEDYGYQNMEAEDFELWWASGKYILRLETEGSAEDALTIARGIRTQE